MLVTGRLREGEHRRCIDRVCVAAQPELCAVIARNPKFVIAGDGGMQIAAQPLPVLVVPVARALQGAGEKFCPTGLAGVARGAGQIGQRCSWEAAPPLTPECAGAVAGVVDWLASIERPGLYTQRRFAGTETLCRLGNRHSPDIEVGGQIGIGQIAEDLQNLIEAFRIGIQGIDLGVAHFPVAAHQLLPQAPVVVGEGEPNLIQEDEHVPGAAGVPFVGHCRIVEHGGRIGESAVVDEARDPKVLFLDIERKEIDGGFHPIDIGPGTHLVVVAEFVPGSPVCPPAVHFWRGHAPASIGLHREPRVAVPGGDLDIFGDAVFAHRGGMGQRGVGGEAGELVGCPSHIVVVLCYLDHLLVGALGEFAGGGMGDKMVALDLTEGGWGIADCEPLGFGGLSEFEVRFQDRIFNRDGEGFGDAGIGAQDDGAAVRRAHLVDAWHQFDIHGNTWKAFQRPISDDVGRGHREEVRLLAKLDRDILHLALGGACDGEGDHCVGGGIEPCALPVAGCGCHAQVAVIAEAQVEGDGFAGTHGACSDSSGVNGRIAVGCVWHDKGGLHAGHAVACNLQVVFEGRLRVVHRERVGDGDVGMLGDEIQVLLKPAPLLICPAMFGPESDFAAVVVQDRVVTDHRIDCSVAAVWLQLKGERVCAEAHSECPAAAAFAGQAVVRIGAALPASSAIDLPVLFWLAAADLSLDGGQAVERSGDGNTGGRRIGG